MSPFFLCHSNEQLLKYEEPNNIWVFPVWTDEQSALTFRNKHAPERTISNFSVEYLIRIMKQQSTSDDLVELNPTQLGNGTLTELSNLIIEPK